MDWNEEKKKIIEKTENTLQALLKAGKINKKIKDVFMKQFCDQFNACEVVLIQIRQNPENKDLVEGFEKKFLTSQIDSSRLMKTTIEALNFDFNKKKSLEKLFSKIRQGTSTNELTKVRANKKNTTIDPITGAATIRRGNDFSVTISGYKELGGPKSSSYQLLDAIVKTLTENGTKSRTVIISLEDYMKLRGLTDRKETKNRAKADLNALNRIDLTWEEKRDGKTRAYSVVHMMERGDIQLNGDIVFTFTETFFNVLKEYPVMNYPVGLLTINSHKNPNSFYLGRKIAEHKNMNVGKKNENIIAVKTLLEDAPSIPSHEDVMRTDRAWNRRIKEPFERDMDADALNKYFSWHYCHREGAPLTDEELRNFDYNTFIGLMIKIDWKEYPDQTARLERKAEEIKKAKKRASK